MFKKILLFCLFCLICVPPVFAQGSTDMWINDGVGNWMTGGNWSLGRPPMYVEQSQGEAVSINNGGTAILSSQSAVKVRDFRLGEQLGQSGTLSISGTGTVLTSLEQAVVGVIGTGVLNLSGGAKLINTYSVAGSISLGSAATGRGTANISGSGTEWDAQFVSIGSSGTGTVNVTDKAKVFGVLASIAEYGGSRGTVDVSGQGVWIFDKTEVGRVGDGTMSVTGGATATGPFQVGVYNGSRGVLNISGKDSAVRMTGTSYVGYDNYSRGTVNITDGGHMTSQAMYIGYNKNSAGEVNVIGDGSRWDADSFYAGYDGNATLNIRDGGMVVRTSPTATAFVGSSIDSTATVNVSGKNAVWQSGELIAGDVGKAYVNITNGGKMTGTSIYFGRTNGGTGECLVSGKGSVLEYDGTSVGVAGNATLRIFDGAVLRPSGESTSSAIIIGRLYTSTAVVHIRNATLETKILQGGYGDATFYIERAANDIRVGSINPDNDGTTLKMTYRIEPLIGVSTVHVSDIADLQRVPLTVIGNTGFQVMLQDHWDLISAGQIANATTFTNQTVFKKLELVNAQAGGKQVARLQYAADTPQWDMDDEITFRFADTNGLKSGSLRVEGEYTFLQAFFKGLDSVAVAQQLADYLNNTMESGLHFSVINANSLLLTGNYLSDYDSGYGYFGWDLSGFNKDYSANVTLLGFNVVPEPSTWAMLLLGLVAMVGFSRKFRGKNRKPT